MIDFKHMKQRAMGADMSFSSFNLQNTSQNKTITFGTVKDSDENYQAIFYRPKSRNKKYNQ